MLKNGQRNTRIILKTYRKNTNLRSEKSINLMSLNLNEFIKPFQSNYREREQESELLREPVKCCGSKLVWRWTSREIYSEIMFHLVCSLKTLWNGLTKKLTGAEIMFLNEKLFECNNKILNRFEQRVQPWFARKIIKPDVNFVENAFYLAKIPLERLFNILNWFRLLVWWWFGSGNIETAVKISKCLYSSKVTTI